jgi:hypothetical protein
MKSAQRVLQSIIALTFVHALLPSSLHAQSEQLAGSARKQASFQTTANAPKYKPGEGLVRFRKGVNEAK